MYLKSQFLLIYVTGGSTTDGVRTRRSFQNNDMAMISQIEPKSIKDAINDESWVEAMKEELLQFEKNQV